MSTRSGFICYLDNALCHQTSVVLLSQYYYFINTWKYRYINYL